MFIFNLLVFIVLGAVAAALVVPAILIIASSQSFAAIFVFVAALVIAIMIILALAIAASILQKICERAIVLENLRLFEAIGQSMKMIKKNPGSVLLTWLIALGLQFGYGIVVSIGVLLVLLVLFLIGLIFYLIFNVIGATIFAILATIGLSIALVTIASGFIVFTSSFWTLAWETLRVKD